MSLPHPFLSPPSISPSLFLLSSLSLPSLTLSHSSLSSLSLLLLLSLFLSSSSVTDPDFPTVGLKIADGRSHLTAKTMAAFRYLYDHHFQHADWFMKVWYPQRYSKKTWVTLVRSKICLVVNRCKYWQCPCAVLWIFQSESLRFGICMAIFSRLAWF